MEQIVIFSSLYSNFIFPTLFLLGAIRPFLLALLLLHFSNYFPAWSNPPFPACFAPTPFLLRSSYLEQIALSCLLCSYSISPTTFPLGAIRPFLLALLLLHFSYVLPTWSKPSYLACFTPTPSHQAHLEGHEQKSLQTTFMQTSELCRCMYLSICT